MARLRWTLALMAAALGAATVQAQQQKAPQRFSYLEVLGPKALGDEHWAFQHHLAFSRDSKLMAAATSSSIFVWTVADGKQVVRMQLPTAAYHHELAFGEDGKTLLCCQGSGSVRGDSTDDAMVRIFSVATGKQVRELPKPKHIRAFSPDGKYMFCHADSQRIDVIDVSTSKVVAVMNGGADCASCACSPDGKLFATHGIYGSLRLWDTRSGKLVRQLRAPAQFGAGAHKFVVFSPDASLLATGGHNCKALDIWSVATGRRLCSIPSEMNFYSAAFAPDNQSIVCNEGAGQPYLYNLVADKVIHRFDPATRTAIVIGFTPDGKRLAIIGEPTAPEPNTRQYAIFVYDVPAAALNPPAAHVDEAPLDKLWAEIGTENELKLQRILKAFRAAPKPAIALIGKHLAAVPKDEQAKVERLIAALDADSADERDQAMKEVQQLAHDFAPLLLAHKENAGAGDIRNRLTFVINRAKDEPLPAALTKALRALALVEQIGSPEAKELLATLAAGAGHARLTVEARAALERLTTGK